MTYGANKVKLSHRESGWKYEFNTLDTLKLVKNGQLEEGDGAVQVAHAKAWLKSRSVIMHIHSVLEMIYNQCRTDPDSQTPMPETVATKPYDWTYTTMYEGSKSQDDASGISFQRGDTTNSSHVIPMDELQRRDPIVFYGQTLLFEDELHDNGSSLLMIRIVSTVTTTRTAT
jgi:type 2A phosphatase activator TIP41